MSDKPKCEAVKPTHSCDNCDWEGVESDIEVTLCQIHHLWDRLDEGGVVPSGECPECGCLCYLIKEEEKQTFWLAKLETEHFSFFALAPNEALAKARILRALNIHGRDYKLPRDWSQPYLDGINAHPIEVGAAYRDSEAITDADGGEL